MGIGNVGRLRSGYVDRKTIRDLSPYCAKKGLDFPAPLDEFFIEKVKKEIDEANRRTKEVLDGDSDDEVPGLRSENY